MFGGIDPQIFKQIPFIAVYCGFLWHEKRSTVFLHSERFSWCFPTSPRMYLDLPLDPSVIPQPLNREFSGQTPGGEFGLTVKGQSPCSPFCVYVIYSGCIYAVLCALLINWSKAAVKQSVSDVNWGARAEEADGLWCIFYMLDKRLILICCNLVKPWKKSSYEKKALMT